MREEIRTAKFAAIEEAAYTLLAEKGYKATSMLAIAKASKTSNQTLYRWYGDKRGLFSKMVAQNAISAQKTLEEALSQNTSATQCLNVVGPMLLGMVTGEKAISLNRAAAADHSGQLGEAIAQSGRETIFPLLRQLMQQGLRENELTGATDTELATLYLNLLIGDLQIRRVIGVLKPLSESGIKERAEFALTALIKLAS